MKKECKKVLFLGTVLLIGGINLFGKAQGTLCIKTSGGINYMNDIQQWKSVQSIIYMLKGTSSEEVHYRKTVNQNFTGETKASINVCILPSFVTSTQSQIAENQNISYSIEPYETTHVIDAVGNEYVEAVWQTPLDSVQTTSEADVSVCTIYGPFTTATPYPISIDLIPSEVTSYLQPTSSCQSDAPEISELADSLVQNISSEVAAVIKLINWVRYNIVWGCPACIPDYQSDALWTLTNRKGNCVNFANLSIALLRAVGIPVRKVHGHMIHDWTTAVAHVWIEVFYPDKGWVQYESSHWMPNEGSLPWTLLTPRHIKAYSSPFPGVSSTGNFDEEIQTTTIIKSSPSLLSSSFSSINPDEFVTFVLTVSNNKENPDTFLITAIATPSNWYISLSQNSVFIDPYAEWGETRDITVTISPPESTFVGDFVTVTVTATSQKTGSTDEMILQVAVLNFHVDVSPMFNDFGDVTLGSPSIPLEIDISNTGDAQLNVSGMTLSDTGNYSFDVNGGSNPAGSTNPTIPVGESRTVTLTFNPISEGSKPANFEVLFNGPDEASVNISLTGNGVPATAIKDERLSEIHGSFADLKNRPNPFNNKTLIEYELTKSNNVHIVIYNLLGQEVRSLVNKQESAGVHTVVWDGRNNFGREANSGVYFCEIYIGDSIQRANMMLFR